MSLFLIAASVAIACDRGYAAGSPLYEQWLASHAVAPEAIRARQGQALFIDPGSARATRLQAIAAAETDSVVTPANAYVGVAFGGVNPSANVDSVLDELGGVNHQLWRFGHYDPLSGGYSEAGAGLAKIDRGLGYWLVTKNPAVITYRGTAAAADTFDIPLSRTTSNQPAWNQLGNPFDFRISSGDMVVMKRDSLYGLQQFNNPFTQTTVKVWNPTTGAYANGSTLTAGTSFWAKVVDKDNGDKWTIWGDPPACGGCLNAGWKPVSMISSGDTTCIFFTTGGGGVIAGLVRYAPQRPFYLFFLDQMFGDIERISIQLDASRFAHMAYAGQYSWPGGVWTTNGMVYWRWDGSNYQGAIVDSTYSAGAYTSLKLDAAGNPRIAYNGNDYSYMKYAYLSGGNWTNEIVDTHWSYDLDMALDRTGTPHVTYVGFDPINFNTVLRYGTRLTNGTWATEDVDLNGAFSGISIGIDGQDKPHILYTGTAGELLYATRQSASNWTSEVVGPGTSGRHGSLEYDAQGNPHAAFTSSIDQHLRHAYKSGGSWTVEVVDPSVNSGGAGLDLNIDRAGHPQIGYYGGANQESLRVAEKLPGTVRVRLPYKPIPGAAEIAGPSKPAGATWAIGVDMEQGERASEPLVVGASSLQPSDRLRLRSSKAPAPPGDYLSLAMSLLDQDGEPGEYVSDFQARSPVMSWEFSAGGLFAPGEALLRFSGADLPAGTRLWLTDLDQGWTREVSLERPEPIAAVAAVRRFRLTATQAGASPPDGKGMALGFRGAYPNPFSGPVGLRFGLGTPAALSVDVIDIAGRVVRRIEDRSPLAGERVLVWDGRDTSGRPMPAGVYLARYRVGGVVGVGRLVKLN